MSLTASRARLLVAARGPITAVRASTASAAERANALSPKEVRGVLRDLAHDASTGQRRQSIATLAELVAQPSLSANRESSGELLARIESAVDAGRLLFLAGWKAEERVTTRIDEKREPNWFPAPKPAPAPKTTWIDVVLVDQDGDPVPRRGFSLKFSDGETREGFFDADGRFGFKGIPNGNCTLTLPDLDESDFAKPKAMDAGESDGEGVVVCKETKGVVVEVATGETLAGIAERFGYLHSSTLWNHVANKSLRERRESPYVLLEGDQILVPEKRPKKASVPTSTETELKVWVERTVVRVRARRMKDEAATVDPASAKIDGNASKKAKLSGEVFEAPVPRDATTVSLVIDGAPVTLAVGALPPIHEEGGVLARLENLGFVPQGARAADDDVDADDEAVELLELGSELFQESASLEATGDLDDDSIAALFERAGA